MTSKIIAQAILNQEKTLSRGFINEVKLKNELENELQKLGFDIISSSIISIGISAEISVFEKVFKSKVLTKEKSKDEFANTYYFENNPILPENLVSVVFVPSMRLC